ncbi:unannotated protein [freshwater metagenome]|uniref:Unannotated protein n=1 Tax=freshwater metagenome TaxID=449393 RepID=A0A6J6FKH5_9ZZZZ
MLLPGTFTKPLVPQVESLEPSVFNRYKRETAVPKDIGVSTVART